MKVIVQTTAKRSSRAVATRLALAPLLLGSIAASPPPPATPAPRAAPVSPATAPAPAAAPRALRWTDQTPAAMVDDARARALAPGATEGDILAAAAVIRALDPRADAEAAEAALGDIAAHLPKSRAEVAGELALLTRALSSDEGTPGGTEADAALGVVTSLSVLGPFRDTGGGLDAHDGPEARGATFADAGQRYDWGTVAVEWRSVPPRYATSAGVPLDVMISPRSESCSYVATVLTVPPRQPFVLRLASSGSVRLAIDGADVAASQDVETSAVFDRLAARVFATPGPHLVTVKVCTGALADDGRVRLRITDPVGAPLRFAASSDLRTYADAARELAHPVPATTPLGRALAPASRELTPLLDAAVLRTLGGADDLRSPRAPGLLDDLARRPELDGDRLAFVGWISPSGANRSSLLDAALARTSGVDAGAHAFAERRVIAQRLNSHLVDWAVATAGAAARNLGNDDGEAVLLRALLDDALGTDALRTEALRSLVSYSHDRPRTTPTALLRELAQLAAAYDPAQALVAREVLGARGYRGHDLVAATGVRGGSALAQAARAALDGGLDDADDGLAVADSLRRAGMHADATEAYRQLTAWAPNRAEAWLGLAHELAIAPDGPGVHDQMLGALARARALTPADAAVRGELALRQGAGAEARDPREGPRSQPPASTARDDEKYLVAPEVFLARRRGVPVGVPDVADRELYWLRAVVLHPDRRVSQLIQYAKEIVVAPRTQEDLVEDLPAEGDLTEILRARVHRRGGGTAFPTEQRDEGSRPSVRWPELEPGDTIEVAIRTWTRGAVGGRGDAPFYFMDYAGASATHPLLYNEVVVEAPKATPFYLDVLHGDADRREERDEGERHITRLIWDHPAVIPDEPLSPNLSEIAPLIAGSTFKDWGDFRAWYTGAIQGFSVPDDEVRRLAATLTRGKATRDAKVEALFNFVADDIRYVNFVSGEGWLPNRPQQLLARREGDCDDKANLLITLLRAVGIEAEPVMLQTRERGQPSIIEARRAVIPMFDHGIAFLPGPGGGEYLDATSPEARLGPLPSMDARAPAFKVQGGPAEVVHLPKSTPEEHGSDVTWQLALHPDGAADLTGEERAVGDAAFWLRTELRQPDARADYVRDHLVAPWLPTVVVERKVDFKGDLPRGSAWVKYGAHAAGVARQEQGELVVAVGQSQGLTSQLAPLVTRTLPVVLPPQLAPSHQDRTTRLVAPAGFAWGALPAGGGEDGGEFGKARLAIGRDPRDPGAIVVKRSLVFDRDVIPAARYPEWRAWLQRVDRLMHKEVRLVPVEGRP